MDQSQLTLNQPLKNWR